MYDDWRVDRQISGVAHFSSPEFWCRWVSSVQAIQQRTAGIAFRPGQGTRQKPVNWGEVCGWNGEITQNMGYWRIAIQLSIWAWRTCEDIKYGCFAILQWQWSGISFITNQFLGGNPAKQMLSPRNLPFELCSGTFQITLDCLICCHLDKST